MFFKLMIEGIVSMILYKNICEAYIWLTTFYPRKMSANNDIFTDSYQLFFLVKIGFSSCKKKCCIIKAKSVQRQATTTLSRADLYFKRKLKFQRYVSSVFY